MLVRHKWFVSYQRSASGFLCGLMQRQAWLTLALSAVRSACASCVLCQWSAHTRHLGRDCPESFVPRASNNTALGTAVFFCLSFFFGGLLFGTWLLVLHAPCCLVLQAKRVYLSHTHAQHGTHTVPACLFVWRMHAFLRVWWLQPCLLACLCLPRLSTFKAFLIPITMSIASQGLCSAPALIPILVCPIQHVSASVPRVNRGRPGH